MSDAQTPGRKDPTTRPHAPEPAHSGATPSPVEPALLCWNHTGVYGDATCGELQKFVHCRNCPDYASAGAQFLNRPLPRDYRREWAARLAQQKQLAAACNASALIFRIGQEWLSLATQVFQEVAERRSIHSLPHRRGGLVLGLGNFRGELIICVALGRLLGLEPEVTPRKPQATERLLVVNWGGHRFAFPADSVHGTHRFNLHELKPPPSTVGKARPTYTQGLFYWNEHAVGFLDAELVFSSISRSLT